MNRSMCMFIEACLAEGFSASKVCRMLHFTCRGRLFVERWQFLLEQDRSFTPKFASNYPEFEIMELDVSLFDPTRYERRMLTLVVPLQLYERVN
jgi:hypothetical protein